MPEAFKDYADSHACSKSITATCRTWSHGLAGKRWDACRPAAASAPKRPLCHRRRPPIHWFDFTKDAVVAYRSRIARSLAASDIVPLQARVSATGLRPSPARRREIVFVLHDAAKLQADGRRSFWCGSRPIPKTFTACMRAEGILPRSAALNRTRGGRARHGQPCVSAAATFASITASATIA